MWTTRTVPKIDRWIVGSRPPGSMGPSELLGRWLRSDVSAPDCRKRAIFHHGTVEFSSPFCRGSARVRQRSPMRGRRAALLLDVCARLVQGQEMVLRYLLRLRRLEQGAHGGKTTWSTRSSLKVKGMKLPMGVIKVLPFFGTAGVMDSIVFEPFGNGCYCFEPTWNRRNNDFCEDVPRGLPLSNRHPIVSNRVGTVRTTVVVRMSHAVCRFRTVIPLFRTEVEPSGQPFL